MLKLTGGSVVLHVLVLFAVLYVPGIRDALNVASMFSDMKMVDRDYKKSVIRDDVVMLDMREKFEYPPGYFPAAMPKQLDFSMPEVITQVQPPVLPTPVMPKATPTPQASPSPTPAASPTPGSVEALTAEQKAKEEREKELNRIAAENNLQRPSEDDINKRPLEDWLKTANEKKVKGEIDLTKSVEITIKGERQPDGKLVNMEVVQKSGDPNLVELAKELVAAVNDSNALKFLRDKDDNVNRPVTITVKLNETQFAAVVESEAPTPERARQMASGFNGLLAVGILAKQGKDEEQIYRSTKLTANGSKIIVNFNMSREAAATMLQKRVKPPAT
jgi:hypothetical protein